MSKKDNAYIITCSKLPGLLAFGDTEKEALKEAKIALYACVCNIYANDLNKIIKHFENELDN